MSDPDPAEALASIKAAREAVGARVGAKGWSYDLPYASIVSVMVGAQALPTGVNVLVAGLCVGILVGMFRNQSRRMGLRMLGTSPRRARWVAFGLGGVLLAAMLAVVYVKHSRPDLPLTPIVAAVMAGVFVLALCASRLWRRVFRAEMREVV